MIVRAIHKEELASAASHIDWCYKLHCLSQPVPWSKTVFKDCVTEPYKLFICFEGKTPLGYAITSQVLDEVTLMDIAVVAQMRNMGVGAKLIECLLSTHVKRDASSIFLEVRESNEAARRLYDRSGFNVIDIRKNYYSANTQGGLKEDAIIMHRDIHH